MLSLRALRNTLRALRELFFWQRVQIKTRSDNKEVYNEYFFYAILTIKVIT
jgi:hypothetical protein